MCYIYLTNNKIAISQCIYFIVTSLNLHPRRKRRWPWETTRRSMMRGAHHSKFISLCFVLSLSQYCQAISTLVKLILPQKRWVHPYRLFSLCFCGIFAPLNHDFVWFLATWKFRLHCHLLYMNIWYMLQKQWVKGNNVKCFMVYANALKISWAEDERHWLFHNIETRY